jgi:hypothetical protein
MFGVLFLNFLFAYFLSSLISRVDFKKSSKSSRTRFWVVWVARQVNPWSIACILSFSLYLFIISCIKWWVILGFPSALFHVILDGENLCLGSISLLSSVVLVISLSHYSWCKTSHWLSLPSCEMWSCLVVFYDGLWSSILRDVSGHVVIRCRGLSKVVLWWGRWLPS